MPIHARARAFLESAAKRQILITDQEQILPPHSIHRVTEALERLMEVTPTSRREVRYRASGLVHWRIPEMPPAASDGRLRFQSGRWKAVQAHVYEFTPLILCGQLHRPNVSALRRRGRSVGVRSCEGGHRLSG